MECRSPNELLEPFQKFLTTFSLNKKSSNKNIYHAELFTLNLLDYDISKKVETLLILIEENSFIPTTNKPTMVTRKTLTMIDHILRNSFVNISFKR